MVKQILASPSTKKISELYTRLSGENPTLILQPEFQRKFVWNDEHKEKFIETLLKGMPIPEIYIAQSGIDVEKIETQEVVVDGQQRLSTILQYINEKEDSKVFGNIVKKFKELNAETERRDFLNYNVVIRDLGDINPEEIIEIFKRINLTRYSLTDIELQNAIYNGEFISAAKEILETITIQDLPFLTDSKLTRMEDLHYLLLILSTLVRGGYFSRDVEVEKCIIEFNNEFPNKEEYQEKINLVFSFIQNLSLDIDSIWLRKSNYFTLFIELYNRYESLDIDSLKGRLLKFENDILKNKNAGKDTNDYGRYYSYMYSGTNSRQARVVRAELLGKYVFDN
ncbi:MULTISPECIES: DUF262 domain-containing protein [Lysinibacillus]|uniref:DUF262 domain-containing protein n=1 Tax=Lysinibacillus fusiformis TaxID=28031 RepID=A0A2I0UX91_9BACI|nr:MULTISPECIES: DUF262 domain-containing protein [Lysinibacillus]KUF34335.1 hypothetical protein AK833_09725 [Lysinibacillus sp. F5]PKU50700.1 DUF262 domain-containing protein [Lysinibacillus fusiformis]SCY68194.1 Protein of unknown function DUF262 [Lysinibacillus sp. SG9]SDB32003.1 Protein of unknown function DUF262 [Lysinibacillus sp. TC-37]SFS92443.1 Protein of unknown function DUF262 [Lysinibacillus sp. SG55]